jgi:hypothetical protein
VAITTALQPIPLSIRAEDAIPCPDPSGRPTPAATARRRSPRAYSPFGRRRLRGPMATVTVRRERAVPPSGREALGGPLRD